MKKSLYLMATLLFAVLVFGAPLAMNTYAEEGFEDGDGSEGDPFQVATAEQLDYIRNYLGEGHADKHFELVANIDLSAWESWTPIGDSTDNFYGHFDGGEKYIISNLTITGSLSSRGLFGHTGEEATLINVRLVDVSISGLNDVGTLVGWNKGAIENCYSTGSVSGSRKTGGLVGRNEAGTITESWTEVDVYGNREVGGLVGFNEVGGSGNAIIDNCHAEGNVTGVGADQRYIGGLVGENWGAISDSHAEGTIEGKRTVGGLVGLSIWSGFSARATIDNCFATGDVTGVNGVGGLAGSITGIGTFIRSSYASGTVSGTYYAGGLVGYNDRNIENSHASGDVQGDSWVGGLVGENVRNIESSYASGNVVGETNVGGLAGRNNRYIEDSYATGSVEGDDSVGGLVGYNYHTIDNSYAIGAVQGTTNVGGLVGNNTWNVNNSYYDLQTTGQDDTGKGIPRTTAQMQQGFANSVIDGEEIYTGWSTSIWGFKPVDQYPYFIDELLANPSFDEANGAHWEVAAGVDRNAVFSVLGQADLHQPGEHPFKLIWQDLNIEAVAGESFMAQMTLAAGSYPEGKSTIVYLDYIDISNDPQQVVLFEPDNNEVAAMPEGSHFENTITLPDDASKITGFSIYRNGPGEFYALNFSLSQVDVVSLPDPTWRNLTAADAQVLSLSNGVIAASVEGYGIALYDGEWTSLTTATALALAAAGSTLVASVEDNGIWIYDGEWSQLTPYTAELLAADNGMVAASFTEHGIWLFDGNTWANLTPAPARALAFDSGRLVASVEDFGTWLYDGNIWEQLAPEVAQHLAISGSNIAASFTGLGIWFYDGNAWDNLVPVPARALALDNGILAASVDDFGTWLYDGEWNNILNVTANLLAIDSGKVAAYFEGQGIWLYE